MKTKKRTKLPFIAVVVFVTLAATLGLLLTNISTTLELRGKAASLKGSPVAPQTQYLTHLTDINLYNLVISLSTTAPESSRPTKVVGLSRELKEFSSRSLTWSCPSPDKTEGQVFCTAQFTLLAAEGEEGFKLTDNQRNSVVFDIQGETARSVIVATWIQNNWAGFFGPAPYYPPEFSETLYLQQGQTITRRAGIAMPASSDIPQSDLSVLIGSPAGLGASSVYGGEESTPFAFKVRYFDITFYNFTFTGTSSFQIKMINHGSPGSVLEEYPQQAVPVTTFR